MPEEKMTTGIPQAPNVGGGFGVALLNGMRRYSAIKSQWKAKNVDELMTVHQLIQQAQKNQDSHALAQAQLKLTGLESQMAEFNIGKAPARFEMEQKVQEKQLRALNPDEQAFVAKTDADAREGMPISEEQKAKYKLLTGTDVVIPEIQPFYVPGMPTAAPAAQAPPPIPAPAGGLGPSGTLITQDQLTPDRATVKVGPKQEPITITPETMPPPINVPGEAPTPYGAPNPSLEAQRGQKIAQDMGTDVPPTVSYNSNAVSFIDNLYKSTVSRANYALAELDKVNARYASMDRLNQRVHAETYAKWKEHYESMYNGIISDYNRDLTEVLNQAEESRRHNQELATRAGVARYETNQKAVAEEANSIIKNQADNASKWFKDYTANDKDGKTAEDITAAYYQARAQVALAGSTVDLDNWYRSTMTRRGFTPMMTGGGTAGEELPRNVRNKTTPSASEGAELIEGPGGTIPPATMLPTEMEDAGTAKEEADRNEELAPLWNPFR